MPELREQDDEAIIHIVTVVAEPNPTYFLIPRAVADMNRPYG